MCTGVVKILAMMYLCSNASVNRREKKKKKKKKASGGTEKPSLKTFDDPDPLFPNYKSFGFHDNNQTDRSFAQNSYILLRTTHGNFLVKFC